MSCPVCARETAPRWRPFCSRRCADVDLGRWMTGAYAVPADEEPPSGADGGADGGADEGADEGVDEGGSGDPSGGTRH